MFTITELLDIAIKIENNGEKVYRRAAEEVAPGATRDALNWLADQEAEHHRWFADLKRRLIDGPKNLVALQMAREIFDDILGRWSFALDEKNLRETKSLKALLDISIEFEKDTVLFYEMLAAFIEDKTVLKQLQLIVDEEKRHIEALKQKQTDYIFQ